MLPLIHYYLGFISSFQQTVSGFSLKYVSVVEGIKQGKISGVVWRRDVSTVMLWNQVTKTHWLWFAFTSPLSLSSADGLSLYEFFVFIGVACNNVYSLCHRVILLRSHVCDFVRSSWSKGGFTGVYCTLNSTMCMQSQHAVNKARSTAHHTAEL